MANYSQLKQSVKNLIKENGQQEITGDIMQSVLLTIIESLGTSAQFAGVARPATNPGSPDGNVFYFAVQQGTYSNFAGIEIKAGDGLTLLVYDGTWKKVPLGTAMQSDMDTLTKDITDLKGHIRYEYNLQKMAALTDNSSSTDIQEAFTPTYAPDGSTPVRKPVSGDFLVTGNVTSIVYESARTRFSFIYGGNKVSITVSDGNSSVSVKKTPVDTRVYDLDKINALTDNSSNEEIQSAIGGNILSPGDLLQGSSDSTWVIESTTQGQYNSSFSYPLKGKLRTVTVTGNQGSQSVTVREEDLVPVRYSYEKINALTDDSTDAEIDEAVTPLDGAAARLPLAGDYLVDANGNSVGIVVSASSAPSFVYTVHPFDMTAVTVHGQSGEYTVTVVKLSITDDILQPLSNLGTPQDGAGKDTAFGRIAKLRQDVGEATDEPAADGSLFARQKQDSVDIAAIKDAGTLRDLFVQNGATANDDGTFTLFGVKQSLEETTNAFAHIPSGQDLSYAYINMKAKVNFCPNIWENPTVKLYMCCYNNNYIEKIHLSGATGTGRGLVMVVDSILDGFYGCINLKDIDCKYINVEKIEYANNTAFYNCYKLETVRIKNLHFNIYFSDSPNLSKESILYMIQNSTATSAITITLHPTAYAMAIADNDIQAALQEKTFVSLAQAETTE